MKRDGGKFHTEYKWALSLPSVLYGSYSTILLSRCTVTGRLRCEDVGRGLASTLSGQFMAAAPNWMSKSFSFASIAAFELSNWRAPVIRPPLRRVDMMVDGGR